MHRHNNLIDAIADPENLKLSVKEVIRGSKKKRYRSSKRILADIDGFINSIRPSILNGTWIPEKYTEFSTVEGRKVRIIQSLPIPSRIVLHAIMNIVGKDLMVKAAIRDTYSSMKGRGMSDGINRLKESLKDVPNTIYCLKTDFTKFYGNIDRFILLKSLGEFIKDKVVMKLLNNIIMSYPNGLPIGYHSSQYLGNYFLDKLDRYIKCDLKVRYYHRYCDDIVILGPSKNYLWRIFAKIKEFCDSKLKVKLKPNYRVFPVDKIGIDFLGYVVKHNSCRIRKCISMKAIKKLRKVESIKRTNELLSSLNGWITNCDDYNNSINFVEYIKKGKSFPIDGKHNSLGLINYMSGMDSVKKFSQLNIPQTFSKFDDCELVSTNSLINIPIIITDAELNISIRNKYESSSSKGKCVIKFRYKMVTISFIRLSLELNF